MRCDTLSVCLSFCSSVLLQEEKQETCKYKSVSSRNFDWDRLRQTAGTRPSQDNKEVSFFKFLLYFKVQGSLEFSSFIGPNVSGKFFYA